MLNGPYPAFGLRPQYDVTRDGRRFLINVPITRARLLGASLGGSFLKQRGIYVGFRMEIQVGLDTIITRCPIDRDRVRRARALSDAEPSR